MGGSHVEERVITGSDELSSGGRLHVVSGALEVLIFSIVLLKIWICIFVLNFLILMHQVQHKHLALVTSAFHFKYTRCFPELVLVYKELQKRPFRLLLQTTCYINIFILYCRVCSDSLFNVRQVKCTNVAFCFMIYLESEILGLLASYRTCKSFESKCCIFSLQ